MRTVFAALIAPILMAQASAPVHKVELVSPHAYATFGQGGNIGLLVGEKDAEQKV